MKMRAYTDQLFLPFLVSRLSYLSGIAHKGGHYISLFEGRINMTANAQTTTKLYYEDVQVGDGLPKLIKSPVTHVQLVRYAGASGDFNPLHTDPKIGEMVGTGGIIAHGMLIMGFVGQLLSDYVGPTALRKFGVRFKGMTHLDDVITCTGTITNK